MKKFDEMDREQRMNIILMALCIALCLFVVAQHFYYNDIVNERNQYVQQINNCSLIQQTTKSEDIYEWVIDYDTTK